MQRRDRNALFDYVPRSAPAVADLIPSLAQSDFNSGMRLVLGPGRILVGADAVYEIARRLPGWRLLAWLYCVPGLHAMLRAAYGWIAANRHRLGRACTDVACQTETPTSRPQESH
jgi:predicted DCC family thiol-disulfide oxidoreductase YuxK